jgi:enoyl-CoA hydratase
MTHQCFDVEISDHIAHVVLKRGDELNTMTPAFWSELPEIVNGISDAGSARVIVLSSTGRHFTAGMDLSVFSGSSLNADDLEPGRKHARLRQTALHLQQSFGCLEAARIPVLAAIQGGCIGGGVDMVTACDMRYVTADAFFCIQEINIGMTADVGTLQRLPKLIPEGVAREMAYTGARMPAERAREVGLVNEIYDDHEALLEGVMSIAAEIAKKSPLAIWGTKETVNYTRDHSVADSLNYIATWQSGMFQPEDMIAAFQAQAGTDDPEFAPLPPSPRGL